ncbi:hypothetical protein DXG01_005312 [Tephrocybe rancida]|nr:hypothetical protein DXG01_005312 [Tephrocybe rancida]
MSSSLMHDNQQGYAPRPVISDKFNASDADVVFKSSDNVLFHIHRKNLETHSEAFPPSEFSTNGEVVPLTEDASTLNNLFECVYPRRSSPIERLPFEYLSKLAEAAEKYEIFSAMVVCKMRLKQLAANNPVEIFNYASKHGYPEILSVAAPFLLDIPPDKAVMMLLPHLVVPWGMLEP